MQTTARSLILDLLSTLRRGSMPVRALIEAGALLGIEENNIRVSLARLYASGRVERDERGRYRLGPAVAAMSGRLRGWRELGTRMRAWRGDWVAVHQPRLGRGASRKRRERALELLGFRELDSGLSIRPNNLRGGVEGARTSLVGLTTGPIDGNEARSTRTKSETANPGRVFRIEELDPSSDLKARSLWDADCLAGEARKSVHRLRGSAAALDQRPEAEAMLESFVVGGEVLRQLMRHPLLPREILDPEPLALLLDEMKRYDALGRGAWARFLARHEVPHRALPLDARQSNRDLMAGSLA